jgi:TetR/AcrR family transcriptional regulator, mexJK operon transcriptional repressor
MATNVDEDRRARAKREQILAGAQRVFLREGFAAASTDTLAKEAGVSKRTLYAYYPTKEELFADVLRDLTIEHPQVRVLDFVRELSPRSSQELRAALIELSRKILSVLMNVDYLALMRTMIAESARFPHLTELVRTTIPGQAFREVTALLRRAQGNGVVLHSDMEVMARMFIGPWLTYVLLDGILRPTGQPQPPDAARIEEIIDLFMRAIVQENVSQRSEQ